MQMIKFLHALFLDLMGVLKIMSNNKYDQRLPILLILFIKL